MNELRKQFEALPEIEQGLRHCHYNESTSDYHADVSHDETHEWHTQFVNGAWYAFQEQQKQIDNIKSIVDSIIPYDMDMDTIRKIGDIKELLK